MLRSPYGQSSRVKGKLPTVDEGRTAYTITMKGDVMRTLQLLTMTCVGLSLFGCGKQESQPKKSTEAAELRDKLRRATAQLEKVESLKDAEVAAAKAEIQSLNTQKRELEATKKAELAEVRNEVRQLTVQSARMEALKDGEIARLKSEDEKTKRRLAEVEALHRAEITKLAAQVTQLAGPEVDPPVNLKDFFQAARDNNLAKVHAGLAVNPQWASAKGGLGLTALHIAASLGYYDMAKLLIVTGADINAKSAGRTALEKAKGQRNIDIIALLELAAKSKNHAAWHNKVPTDLTSFFEVVKLGLVDNVRAGLKANPRWVHAKNRAGDTAFIVAALQGSRDIAELLLAQGADVNAAGEWNRTVLHVVALRGQKETVEFLLSRGANPNLKDHEGNTVLDMALQNKHAKIADLLRRHGARE